MRLVTYQRGDGAERAGALIDGDARIVDLAEAHAALSREPGPTGQRIQVNKPRGSPVNQRL